MPSAEPRARALISILVAALGAAAGCARAPVVPDPGVPWSGRALSSPAPALLEEAGRVEAGAGEKDGAVVLFEDVNVTIDRTGRVSTRARVVVKVLGRAGAERWSAIDVRYLPESEARPVVRARVIRVGGEQRFDGRLAGAEPAEEGAPSGARARVLRAALPGVEPGAVVEIETLLRQRRPLLAGGALVAREVGGPDRRLRSRLTVTVPADGPLAWKAPGLPGLHPEQRSTAGGRLLVFELGARPARAPAGGGAWPAVLVSTAPDWATVAARYHRVLERKLGEDLAPVARGLISEAAIPSAKVERLLAHVQQAVALAPGAFGGEPRPPAEVLERGAGDAQDRALLLVALLRGVGVPARLALVRGDRPDDVDPELPGLGAFDRALVRVGEGASASWLDPAAGGGAPGALSADLAGRLALVIDPHTTALERTPGPRPDAPAPVAEAPLQRDEPAPPAAEVVTEAVAAAPEDDEAEAAAPPPPAPAPRPRRPRPAGAERIADLLDELEEHPERAAQRLELAEALLGLGLREASVREAREAADRAPSSRAFLVWARALRRDPVGRVARSDAAAARAAEGVLRRALEATPPDDGLRTELADLLLEGEAGGADGLAEALAHHRAVRARNRRPSPGYLRALVRAAEGGKPDALAELEREARAAPAPERDTLVALAAAAARGPEAAAAALRALGLVPGASAEALARAAALARGEWRDYALAIRLYDRARALAPSPTLERALAATRALVPHEEAIRGRRAAEVVKRLVVAARARDSFVAARRELVHPCAGALELGALREQLGYPAGAEQRPDVAADARLAALEMAGEGDDRSGHRVTAWSLGPPGGQGRGGEPSFTVFLASTGGAPQVVAVGAEGEARGGALACAAERMLREGNLEGARRWLDWVDEELSPEGAPPESREDPEERAPFELAWRRDLPAPLPRVRAGIALLAPQRDPARATAWLAAAPALGRSDAEREAFMLARVSALAAAGNQAKTLAAARAVAAKFPRSARALALLARRLEEAGKRDEAGRVLERGLADPRVGGARALARGRLLLRSRANDTVAVEAEVRRLIDAGEATPEALDLSARHAVAHGRVDAEIAERARAAVERSQRRVPAYLHTLAMVEATLARPREARAALHEAVDLRGGQVRDEDWLVVGLIAESLGLVEDAVASYRNLHKRENAPADPYDPWSIAQARLAALKSVAAR
jgi:transglutaminase-like putative cysteine protease/tetratricopeptide (TPR) repeat protein